MIQYLWGLLNDISFLNILVLVSLNVPGMVQIIQGTLLNFIYMDILQTGLWLDNWIFTHEDDDNDGVLNEYFE